MIDGHIGEEISVNVYSVNTNLTGNINRNVVKSTNFSTFVI